MKKKKDSRDPVQLTLREIERYIERYPELQPYANRFTHVVLDRMNSIVYRASIVCHLMGVRETDDPRFYKKVLDKIESRYPSWFEIKDDVVHGRRTKFPKLSDYSGSKF